MSITPEIHNAIVRLCGSDLPAQLVEAMVLTESGGDIYAWKVEPSYRYLWDISKRAPFRALTAAEITSEKAPADFPLLVGIESRDTEWWGQQASWGPLQLMGAVAREYGYKKSFPALCSIDDGLSCGIHHLVKLRDRFNAKFGWPGVVAAYNAGSPRFMGDGKTFVNQEYVDKVTAHGGFPYAG